MSDVHVLTNLPDGTAIGVDDDGHSYRGVRVDVPYEDMTVTTVVADDGQSYQRTITLPDGSIYGHGEFSYEGFAKMAKVQALLDDTDVDEKQLQQQWQEQLAVNELEAKPTPASVWSWTLLPAAQEQG